MPARSLAHKIAAFIAAVACLMFALAVRDTPERPLPAPAPTSQPAPPEDSASLIVEVLAVTAALQTQGLELPDAAVPGEPDAGVALEVARPLAQAMVRVFSNDQGRFRLVGSARTDETGRVRMTSLPRGAVWVIAEAEGRSRSSTQLVLDDEERLCALSLEVARTLATTVLDEQGTPLKDATVLVTGKDPLPFGALTDQNGYAKVGRLGRSPYRVKASARGFESATVTGITGQVTLRLRRLGALQVRVEDGEGNPVPEATVTLSGTSLWPARSVTTNRSGIANVRGLLAGSFDLRARKDKQVSRTELGVLLGRGEERAVTLRLVPGRFVTVWVTDGEGEPATPVPNADVVIAESGLSAFPERGRTAESGQVTLGPFEPGLLSASATSRDFVGTAVVAVPETLTGPLRLGLRRGGTVRGTVVDAFDHPVAGASIEIIGTDVLGFPVAETPRQRELQASGFARALAGPEALLPLGELGVTKGPVPGIPGAASGSGDYLLSTPEYRTRREPIVASSDTDNWVTRYDGSFVAHPVTPGRLRALVRHPAYVEGQSEPFTLKPGVSADVKVVLRSGGALEGVVLDRFGRTVGGVRVELSSVAGSRTLATYTSEDGAFAFAALPPEVTVTVARADSPDRPVLREAVTIREGKRESIRLVLPEAREGIDCQVSDERGYPIENAEVVVSSLNSSSPLRQTRFTGRDGLATIEDARGLELSVTAESPGYAPVTARFGKAPAEIRLVLRRGVRVTGRVTHVRGRVAVAHARVTLVSAGRRRMTSTDGEGIWQLSDVPVGPVHLLIEAQGLPSLELEREINAQSREDRPLDLGEFDLPESGSVSGKVLDRSGQPVAGAKVGTQPLAGLVPLAAGASGQAVTDEHGEFHLSPVAIGSTRIHARAPGIGQGQSEPVEVARDSERSGVVVRLLTAIDDDATDAAGSSVAIALSMQSGALVVSFVAAGSEAERAGLRLGDKLLSLDGRPTTELSDARARLSGPENQDVLVEVERAGTRLKLRTVREPVRR